MERVNLGDEVKDSVTGLKGIAVCRMTWLHGCDRIIIQPTGVDKAGKPFENYTADEPQLIVLKKKKQKEGDHKTGGPGYAFSVGKETPSRY